MKINRIIYSKRDGFLHLSSSTVKNTFLQEFVVRLWDIFNSNTKELEKALIKTYPRDTIEVTEEEAVIIVKINEENNGATKKDYTKEEWKRLTYKEQGRILVYDFLADKRIIELTKSSEKKILRLVKPKDLNPKKAEEITIEEAIAILEKEDCKRLKVFDEFLSEYEAYFEEYKIEQ